MAIFQKLVSIGTEAPESESIRSQLYAWFQEAPMAPRMFVTRHLTVSHNSIFDFVYDWGIPFPADVCALLDYEWGSRQRLPAVLVDNPDE